MVEIQTPITDVYITWKCTSSFTTCPIGFEVAGYLRRNDSVFAKDSSATSWMLKKIQIVPSTVAFEGIEPDHNTFPLHLSRLGEFLSCQGQFGLLNRLFRSFRLKKESGIASKSKGQYKKTATTTTARIALKTTSHLLS